MENALEIHFKIYSTSTQKRHIRRTPISHKMEINLQRFSLTMSHYSNFFLSKKAQLKGDKNDTLTLFIAFEFVFT
ncbi:CLUMA_CG013782, isoform A [Clunio marinus]|uniref:CLUMA_CG013782, isoform A n=1 Tax=Clunio marinus TaxID=568069 RepID=A0A1J1IPU3_9DIPT|nr:CLUMA_CG013782, isoform A [Clunio marinus]